MELHPSHLYVFLFIVLPLILAISVPAIFFYKAYKFQKELKAQSDALLKKLENL